MTPGLIVGLFVLLGVVGAAGGLTVYALKKPGRSTPDDPPGQTSLLPGPRPGVSEADPEAAARPDHPLH